ncbi:MAG: hypothetical protein ACLQOO_27385 [Terriglobia bacterium]
MGFRRLLFPLCLTLCAFTVGGTVLCEPSFAWEEYSRTSHQRTRLFSTGTLTIDTRVGDLHIEGWDDPYVEVEAEKVVRANSKVKAGLLYDQIQVLLEGQDKQVVLRTTYPPRRLWRPFRGESQLTVNLRVKMPYDASLSLKCVDGDVRIRGLAGRQQIRVNYGDVEIDVPDVYNLRSLDARALLGYVQSDLHGLGQDSAGLGKRTSFWNSGGTQEITVRVRMGGVFIYGDSY